MELVRIDTQRAYERIWERITTLQLPPGAPIDEQALAEDFEMGVAPVREALRLLAHENLVEITPRHGLYVSGVSLADLEEISEMRLPLEGLCARLAARRATADDLAVLEALRREQAAVSTEGETTTGKAERDAVSRRFFDLDHKFHQAVARAARNKYLYQTLERLFGLSQRLWYLALPHLAFLPSAVEKHLDLVGAIEAHDADRAERIMRDHVQAFYDQVKVVLEEQQEEESHP